ncbi:hypothetical protein [Chondromyces crocatus]|uniref:Uncharacterized protein n=1 Tax=Chondromyces crocatus TaxID=52 RepID=A0A0K1EHJ1_CHOCO|nr:hypothetical protein [Chondromyces crocatus]AKT40341.1 uncharacterized protein CMC5_044940 [Chondromyces crocatus]
MGGWDGVGKLSGRGRAMARAVLHAGLAVLVMASVLFAGRAYWWCAPMQQAMQQCCCVSTPDASVVVEPGEQTIRFACCDSKAIDTLPQAHGAAPSLEVPPAAVFAVLPATVSLTPPVRFTEALRDPLSIATRKDPIRAGPGRPSESCALLQVYRC